MVKAELLQELRIIEIEIKKSIDTINENTRANETNKIYLNKQLGKKELVENWLSKIEVNETK